MNENDIREFLCRELGKEYPNVRVTEWGTVYCAAPTSPVVCRISQSIRGDLIVSIESPVLIDVVEDAPLYQMLSMLQHRQEFGGIFVAGGENENLIMIAVHAHLFADGLQREHAVRAAQYVNAEAIELIELLETISPPVGGRRAYQTG